MYSAKTEFENAAIFIISGITLYAVLWWVNAAGGKALLTSGIICLIGFFLLGNAIRIAAEENPKTTGNNRVMIESESGPKDGYDIPVEITTVVFPERQLEKTRLQYWTPEKFDS